MEKKKINFTRLVESLRWYEKEYKGSIMDEDDKKTFSLAADVLEDLLQSVAEWTAKYEEERDKNKDAVPVVRCRDCQWFDANGDYYDAYCDKNGISVEEDFFCADGERKDGADDGRTC